MNVPNAPCPALRAWALATLLVSAAIAATAMRPDTPMSAANDAPELATMIPERFAGWQALPEAAPLTIDPRVSARVDTTYTDTLERVYHHNDGALVMLSVAYGARQLDDNLQAHRPEYCYRAQGFHIDESVDTLVSTAHGDLRVRRLLTRRAQRVEPVTYWLTVGQRTVLPGFGRQLVQLSYGLRGEIPDGLLVRISSLDATTARAWPIHEHFIADLLQALRDPDRERLTGKLPESASAQRF